MVVYLIKCRLEAFHEIRYVGQTSYRLEYRMTQHRSGRLFIDKLMRVIGADNFEAEVLEKCDTRAMLLERERYWIRKLGTLWPAGCNMPNGRNSFFKSTGSFGRRRQVQPKSPQRRNKFEEIYFDLKQKIEQGSYAFQSLLPGETILTEEYGCSRMTVRRALSGLQKLGYIQAIQGVGTQVLRQPIEHRTSFLLGSIESFKETVRRNHLKARTRVVSFRTFIADDEFASKTGFDLGSEILRVHRVRIIDGKPLILDKNYFLKSAVNGLTRDVASRSIYEFLENVLGMKIMTSKRRVTVELADECDRKYLEFRGYRHEKSRRPPLKIFSVDLVDGLF